MDNFTLDFEKPLVEIKQQIIKLEKFSKENDVDMSDKIKQLELKFEQEQKNIFTNLSPWQRITLARHPKRPYSMDYVSRMMTDFVELKGDRRYGDDPAMICGFAKLDGEKVMVIAQQKGRDVKERSLRNFGMSHPEGYRKALRLMKLANQSGAPIITFIDTPGAYPGVASEERHVGEAIAVNLKEMFNIEVPIISVVIGEGGSGGALGIGIANKFLILENAYYSVISPEGCAGIIWKDGSKSAEAAAAMKITPSNLKEFGIVDEIVSEPQGGAHRNHDTSADLLKVSIAKHLQELKQLNGEEMRDQRYERFRALGAFLEK